MRADMTQSAAGRLQICKRINFPHISTRRFEFGFVEDTSERTRPLRANVTTVQCPVADVQMGIGISPIRPS